MHASLACPYSNVCTEYIKHHVSYRLALFETIQRGKLFHHYDRLLLTEVCGLTVFFGGYETTKRAYHSFLFQDRWKALNVVGAGLTAGFLYNVVSYPVSRWRMGLSQAFKGISTKAFVAMPANACGFLMYELTLSNEDTFLNREGNR